MPAADYIQMLRDRLALCARDGCAGFPSFDALLLPTSPIVAPTIAEVSNADTFFAKERSALLRNTPPLANFFDLCAISLPLPREGGLPVGLMLVTRNGERPQTSSSLAAAVQASLAG